MGKASLLSTMRFQGNNRKDSPGPSSQLKRRTVPRYSLEEGASYVASSKNLLCCCPDPSWLTFNITAKYGS